MLINYLSNEKCHMAGDETSAPVARCSRSVGPVVRKNMRLRTSRARDSVGLRARGLGRRAPLPTKTSRVLVHCSGGHFCGLTSSQVFTISW